MSPALGGPSLTARSVARRRGSRWSALQRLTKRRDVQPTIAVATTGARQIVFRRNGLFSLQGGRRWKLARLPGTVRADTQPSLSASGVGFSLVFARPAGATAGIYVARTSAISGRWPSRPSRLTASRIDHNPFIGADAFTREAIVFERG